MGVLDTLKKSERHRPHFMNKVILIGFAGNEPKTVVFANEKSKTTFSLATTDFFGKTKRTSWHNVATWNGLGKIAETLLKKGTHVAIEGSIVYREYTNKQDEKVFVTEIVADKLEVLDKISKSAETTGKVAPDMSPIVTEDPGEDLPF